MIFSEHVRTAHVACLRRSSRTPSPRTGRRDSRARTSGATPAHAVALAALLALSACAAHETSGVAGPDGAAQAAAARDAARAQQARDRSNDTELFDATAYSIEGKTASGKQAREGICAADPDVLPLGSRVRVHDAGAYSGECEIADTGRAIKGREIDIYLASDREAEEFGKKKVRVERLSSAQ